MNEQRIALNLVENAKTPLLGSISKEGYPNIKAMLQPRIREGLKEFYFSTNTSSMRVSQYLANDKACLYFVDNVKFIGLMLTGKVEILQDQETKNKVWQDGDEKYYALGVTDPDYCVIKFTSEHARMYKSLSVTDFEIE